MLGGIPAEEFTTNAFSIFGPVNLLRREDIDSQDALWARCAELMGEDIVACISSALRARRIRTGY